jgi:hypothetical protein
MDTLLRDDIGVCLAPPDPAHLGAVARRAPARSAGLAAPATGAAAHQASAVAAREGRPVALGRALARLDRMANGIVIVKPETVIGLAPTRLPTLVGWTSRGRIGRPTVPADIRTLIRTMAEANPHWGAPRMHGELQKLGIDAVRRPSRNIWCASAGLHHRPGARSRGITAARSWRPISSWSRLRPTVSSSMCTTVDRSLRNQRAHRLCLGVEIEHLVPHLAAPTRLLVSTKRHGRVEHAVAIEPYRSCAEL